MVSRGRLMRPMKVPSGVRMTPAWGETAAPGYDCPDCEQKGGATCACSWSKTNRPWPKLSVTPWWPRALRCTSAPARATPGEVALVEFLANNPRKVCRRALISQHLYEPEEECTSNVVDVFIRFLRGKIDKGFGFPLILTRWGQGYLLRDEPPAASNTEP